jgi:RHS repeat-associated protein
MMHAAHIRRALRDRKRNHSSDNRRRKLLFESLENRRLMAVVNWDGGGDGTSWSNALNWDGNFLPGAADDVVINVVSPTTVVHNSGTTSIRSLSVANTLDISGGTLSVSNDSQVTNRLVLSGGTLAGGGQISVSGTLDWTLGTMSGSGQTIVTSTGTLNLTTSSHNLNRVLRNDGTANWASGRVFFNNGTFNNLGTFNANFNTNLDFVNFAGTAAFNNTGIFNKLGTGTAQISTSGSVTFNNTGTVSLQAGTLELRSGGSHSGPLTGVSGAALSLGGNHTFAAGANITGGLDLVFATTSLTSNALVNTTGSATFSGFVTSSVSTFNQSVSVGGPSTFSTGTTNFNGSLSLGSSMTIASGTANLGTNSLTFSNVDLTGGTLSGSGTTTIIGTLNWTSGTMSGAGQTIVAASASLQLGGTSHTLNRTLRNDGIASWIAGLIDINNGTFDSFGNFSVNSSSTLEMKNFSGTAVFNNAGSFNKLGTGSAQISSQGAVAFNNTGTVNIQAGALELRGGGNHTGPITGASGSTLNLRGNHSFAAGANIAGGLDLVFATTLLTSDALVNTTGSATFSGFVTSSVSTFNQSVSVGRSVTFSTGTTNFNGLLAIAGDLFITSGVANLGNNSFTFRNLTLSGGTLNGAGDIHVTEVLDWSLGTMSGSGQTIVTSTGTLNLTTSTHNLNRVLRNEGTANWTSGRVFFNNGAFNNLGTFNANFNADLDFGNFAGTAAFNNTGTFNQLGIGAAQISTSGNVTFNNSGIIDVQAGTLDVRSVLTGSSTSNALRSSPAGTITTRGQLISQSTNASLYNPRGTSILAGSGTSLTPQLFEVMSRDAGNTSEGFVSNYAMGKLELGNSNYVKLVDQFDNATGSGLESLYVNAIKVPASSTLNLNGLKVYARESQILGTLVGGTVTLVPDGGLMALDSSSHGRIATNGQLDEWSFYGRAGRGLAVELNPGTSGSPVAYSSTLGFGLVQVLDPSNNIIASGENSVSGLSTTLSNFILPTSGLYRVRIAASTAQPTSVGAYTLSINDANIDTTPLVLNKQTLGTIEVPYSVDRWKFSGSAGQQVRLLFTKSNSPSIRFTLTGPNGYVGFSNIANNSSLLTLPQAGTYILTVDTGGGQPGSYSFQMQDLSQTTLTLGVPYTGLLTGDYSSQVFKINVTQPTPIALLLDDSTNSDRNEIYVDFGKIPTRTSYRYKSNDSTSADQQLVVPLAPIGECYIVIFGASISAPSNFTLTATANALAINHSTPISSASNTDLTLEVQGAIFDSNTTVKLIGPSNIPYIPSALRIDSSTQLAADFAAGTLPAGVYQLRIDKQGGTSATLPNAITIVAGGEAKLETNLILPEALGRRAPATLYLEYANIGTATMPAPLISIKSDDADNSDHPQLSLDPNRIVSGFWTNANPDGFGESVQIYASGSTPGVLNPGERVRIPIYYAGLKTTDPADMFVEFNTEVFEAGNSSPIDWNGLATSLKPAWIPLDAWSAVYSNLQQQIGATWGDYVQMLSRNAKYLGRFGIKTSNVEDLYQLELQRAKGLDYPGVLASAIDASVPTAGFSLEFSRFFGNTVTSRYHDGPFGRGWEASWQYSLEKLADGTLVVHESSDNLRRFQPDTRRVGAYFSQTGDAGVMKAISGGYELKETSGQITRYRSDGKLEYIQDINGNRITAAYTANRLTALSSNSSGSIAITYNGAGRISGITDSLGHVTTFTYDPSSTFLLSSTNEAGTTLYSYKNGSNLAQRYAIESVTGPDGVSRTLEYDNRGRLIASFLTGNIDRVDLAYDMAPGQVTLTDQANVASKAFFDHRGLLVRSEDGLGHFTVNTYNDARQLIESSDDLGRKTNYTRCDCGRPKTITDTTGTTILTFTLGGPNNAPTAYIDAKGNTTQYTYDSVGNVTAVTYPDGTKETATYDVQGNLDVTANRRGQLLDRTVNSKGQVTREAWSDGTVRDYVYDSRSRLISATDSIAGTTTLDYDNADRLTKVTYPNGRWIQYSYDAAGRRTQILDHTGFATKYVYDTAGRLSELKDTNNQRIVLYTYDVASRLAREDKGNGTYTIYGYDVLGRETSIFHYQANGTVNSKFIYTYDAAGRRDTQTTIDGVWTYRYDLLDQLTRAIFVSTNAQIPNQDLSYQYDALGNRTQTILNGTTTAYASNNMNQYTTAGSTTFTYDLDGNLILEVGPQGAKQYTYDQINRLIQVKTPQGVWEYEYDILGNRTAVIQNGVRTEYLVDIQGLGNIIGEFDQAGTLTTTYSLGFGLEAGFRTGTANYFDFDAIGSTSGLTDSTGGYVDRYSYDPWGSTLLENETVVNPFEFVGEFGVMDEGNGLHFMRARYYDAAFGRFTSQDPKRLDGGQLNLYSYAAQNPIAFIDPNGLVCKELEDYHDLVSDLREARAGLEGRRKELEALLDKATTAAVKRAKKRDIDRAGEASRSAARYAERIKAIDDKIAEIDALSDELGDAPDCDNLPTPPPATIPQPVPVPQPPANSGTKTKTPAAAAKDPNEKFGAAGFGAQAYIKSDAFIPYRVEFENLGAGSVPTPTRPATAPAQRVEVTDQLSANLDWNTIEFAEFGFGDTVLVIPDRQNYFFTTVPITYNGKFFNVEVELNFDVTTGMLRVVFQSLDPNTLLPPDVLTGFLPPEDGDGIGKGHVTFRVKPKSGLPSGTELRNVARISFDGQDIIDTNQIDPEDPSKGVSRDREALNTIDAVAPTSSIAPLPSLVRQSRTTISWSGVDDTAGSGVDYYDVYVSDNGDLYQLLLGKTTQTSLQFIGLSGHSYSFYSLATDHVGLRQAVPITANASTTFQYAPPTDIQITNSSIVENALPNTLIGSLSTVDPDPGVDFTYAFAVGSGDVDNTSFKLVGNQLFSNATFNYESKPQYSIRVRTTDQDALFFEKTFTINVTDINEPPVLSIDNASVVGDVLAPIVNSGSWSDPELGNVSLISSLGNITKNANGTWQWSYTPSGKLTNQNVIVTADDGQHAPFISFTVSALVNIPNSKVYYLGSSFSQGGNNVNAALDGTKVLAKSGLVPQTLSYTNLINTTRGINGLVLDIAGLVASNLTVSDFVFRISPTGLFNETANPPQSWQVAPAPTNIVVTPGNATTPARVRLEWPDNDIANRWLQIQVIANANTGLASTRVFYVGHLQGEVNGQVTGGSFFVTTQDQSAVLPLGLATVGVPRDLDKNGFVTTQDLTSVRNSITAGRTLRVITIPASGSINEGAVAGNVGSALSVDDQTLAVRPMDSSWLPSVVVIMPNILASLDRSWSASSVGQVSLELKVSQSNQITVGVANQMAGSNLVGTKYPAKHNQNSQSELKRRDKEKNNIAPVLSPRLVDCVFEE